MIVSSAAAAPIVKNQCGSAPTGQTDIVILGGTCRMALRVVQARDVPIPGTHYLGFTAAGFACRVTQEGRDPGRPAKYRCHRGTTVVTWAYHP